jgi:hypothetical protein
VQLRRSTVVYKERDASITTTYPSKYFSIVSTKSGATTTRYFHADQVNSTNVVTDASGTVLQVLDYYPYGST